MQTKESNAANKAWKIIRLALQWTRKDEVLGRRFLNMDLTKHIRSLPYITKSSSLDYRERQFSFDDTPVFLLNTHRPKLLRFKFPSIPCLNPQVDFDHDFKYGDYNNFDRYYYNNMATKSILGNANDDNECEEKEKEACQECIIHEEEIIDVNVRADEFIAKFYEQTKYECKKENHQA